MSDTSSLKERFIATRGYWDAGSEALLAADPRFFESAVELSEAAQRSRVLSPKLCALLRLAFDATITHVDREAVAQDVKHALALGASREEILEVCHLSAVVSIHSCSLGLSVLGEELALLNRESELKPTQDAARCEAIKQEFTRQRGYWTSTWDTLLSSSPDFFEAYTHYSSHPWLAGVLPPKEKEFVYIAIDVAVHHLYEPGLRIHIKNALRYGATAQEISAILHLLSAEGLRSSCVGAQALSTVSAPG